MEQLSRTVECPVGRVQAGPSWTKNALGYVIMRLWEQTMDEATRETFLTLNWSFTDHRQSDVSFLRLTIQHKQELLWHSTVTLTNMCWSVSLLVVFWRSYRLQLETRLMKVDVGFRETSSKQSSRTEGQRKLLQSWRTLHNRVNEGSSLQAIPLTILISIRHIVVMKSID